MTNDLNQIFQSPAYMNIVKAFTQVFGEEGWRMNCLWPTGNTNDFNATMDVNGLTRAAYVSVSDTHEHGMYSRGPGGGVSVYVPRKAGQFAFQDGAMCDAVGDLVGTEEEQYRYRWGADGEDYPGIEGYVQILKRYLDKKKSDNENTGNT